MERNPENHRHHAALLVALQLDVRDAQQVQRVAALYDELARKFPRSLAVRRLPLDFKVLPWNLMSAFCQGTKHA